MSEHTELPWCIPVGDQNGFIICSGDDPAKPGDILMVVRAPSGRRTVATDQQVNANVALMVKAVNSHDALVKALSDALCELSACAEQMGCRKGGSVRRAQEAARDALALVGGSKE